MELFWSNKREKPDIEFITKAKPKKLELVPKKKRVGNSFTGGPEFTDMPHFVSEEPRRIHRWLLRIPTELGVEDYWCSFARPTAMRHLNEVEIPYMSTSTWTTGRMGWNDLYLEIRDSNSSGHGLTEWFQSTMTTMTGRQGYGGSPKKTVTVEMLDPTGIVVEKWTLMGCIPTEINMHQTFDDTDSILTVNLSIDRAILNT